MLAISFTDGITASISRLPNEIRRATVRAINTTIDSTRGFMAKRLSVETGIPASVLDAKLATTRATAERLEGEVSARTKAGQKLIPILQLQAVQVGRGPN